MIGRFLWTSACVALFAGCVAAPTDGVRRNRMQECPPGQVQICKGDNEPSSGGDEEIPEYDLCYCESIM